jgi:hypothetical protein
VKNVKTDDLLLEAWKQQIDAGRRLMELQAELTCASAQKWAAYWRGLCAGAVPRASSQATGASTAPAALVKARKKRAS